MSKVVLFGSYLLVIIWGIGFFILHLSGFVHIILAFAILGFVFRLLYNKSFVK